MYFFTHFVLFSLAYFSSASSAYQCTLANAKDVTQMNTGALTQSTSLDMTGDLDVSMIGSNMQLQALENASGYIKARKRTLEVISKKLKRRNTGSGNGGKIRARTPANSSGDTKSSMTCSSSETCFKADDEVACFNSATSTMRDPWGATLNVESGDYKLPDGTTGNTLTNPGPLENYDPGSEVYDDDENGSTATAVGSRENGTPSSNTGSGTANRNNGGGPEILMNDAMPMAIRQSGWALVGFVGVMGVIEWM